MYGVLVSLTGNQNNVYVFCVDVFHLPYYSELSFTNLTYMASYMCLLMCKRHWKHCHVKCVEKYSRKKKENCKKNMHILVSSQRYQDSKHLLLWIIWVKTAPCTNIDCTKRHKKLRARTRRHMSAQKISRVCIKFKLWNPEPVKQALFNIFGIIWQLKEKNVFKAI